MAEISLTVKSDADQAVKDFQRLAGASEEAQATIKKFQSEFKDKSIDEFIAKNKLAAIGVSTTGGQIAGAKAEVKGLEKQMQKLVKQGLDPSSESFGRLQEELTQSRRQLTQLQAEAGKTKNVKSSFAGLADTFTAVKLASLGAVGAVAGFATGLKSGIDAASDLAEAQSKLRQTFSSVSSEAEAMASAVASSLGVSNTAAMEMLATTGGLLQNFGFTADEALNTAESVSVLASDIAAFNNLPTEQVIHAINSALVGETESLKSFGTVVNQATIKQGLLDAGLQDLTGDAQKHAQALVVLNEIQRQNSSALGESERSADSYASTVRKMDAAWTNFEATIGASILPSFTSILQDITMLVQGLSGELGKIQKANLAQNIKDTDKALQSLNMTAGKTSMLASQVQAALNSAEYGGLAEGKRQLEALKKVYGETAVNAEALALKSKGLAPIQWLGKSVDTYWADAKKQIADYNAQLDLQNSKNKTSSESKSRKTTSAVTASPVMNANAGPQQEEYSNWWSDYGQLTDGSVMVEGWEALSNAINGTSKSSEEFWKKNGKSIETMRTGLNFTTTAMTSLGGSMQTLMQNLGKSAKEWFYFSQGIAIAQATINTFEGFTKALAQGGIWGAAQGAIVLAAGMAKVAAIATTKPSAETGLENYTVPDIRQYKNDSYPVMAQAGETVSVTPRGEEANGQQNISIQLNEQTLFRAINKGIRNGSVVISQKNVGRSVFQR